MESIFLYIKNHLIFFKFSALFINLIGACLLFFSVKKDKRMLFDDPSGKKYYPVATLDETKAKLGIFLIIIGIFINILIQLSQ